MRVSITPEQLAAINIRLTSTCTNIEVGRWDSTGRYVEVSQFARTRLIETVKISPGGTVTVLSSGV